MVNEYIKYSHVCIYNVYVCVCACFCLYEWVLKFVNLEILRAQIAWKINDFEIVRCVFQNLYFPKKKDTVKPLNFSAFFVGILYRNKCQVLSRHLFRLARQIILCVLMNNHRPEIPFHVQFLHFPSLILITLNISTIFFFIFYSIVFPRVRRPTFRASPLRFRRQTDNVLALHPSVTFSVQYKILLCNSLLK